MQILGMALEDDMATVPTLVAVVLVMQRLVHVANEVDYEPQGFGLRRPVCLGVSQDAARHFSVLPITQSPLGHSRMQCQQNKSAITRGFIPPATGRYAVAREVGPIEKAS
jgi:hypothetical protein